MSMYKRQTNAHVDDVNTNSSNFHTSIKVHAIKPGKCIVYIEGHRLYNFIKCISFTEDHFCHRKQCRP